MASAALEAGKDVFVEKPMTLTAAESAKLIELAESNDQRVLMVGHLLLYQPAIQWIKKQLDEGMLGEVFSLHQERLKLGRARYIENVTWSLGVHDLAVLLFLTDEDPDSVFASGHCGLQERVEDDVYVHLHFPSGIRAHLHNSWLWPENRRGLTIVGEKGMLVYDEVNQRVIHHRKDDQCRTEQRGFWGRDRFFGKRAAAGLGTAAFHRLLSRAIHTAVRRSEWSSRGRRSGEDCGIRELRQREPRNQANEANFDRPMD